jgi:hypothetical protein
MSKHGGFSNHKATYQSWQDMKQRCLNPRSRQYPNYGGRGITICSSWLASFEHFIADMGPKPEGLSLDRIDNDRGYEPENCRWASRWEQNANQRRTLLLTLNGETLPLENWAHKIGLNPKTVWARVSRGWPIEAALYPKRLQGQHTAKAEAIAALQGEQP